jgi:hypothetical protein
MKQIFFCILSLVLLTSLLIPHPAFAGKEEAIGTVVAVRGEVTAVAGSGAKRGLALKSPIFRDDTVRTGNGRVQLMFSDNTLISLGRESEMVISEYDWQPDGKSGTMKTRIKEGTFRVMGGAITKVAPQNFSTETPAATIGIRGSMYAGKATPDSLIVVFQGGKGIDVTNAAGTVAITKPGFGTRVVGLGRPPLRPVRFTADDLQAINEGLGSHAEQDQGSERGQEEGGQKADESGQGNSREEGTSSGGQAHEGSDGDTGGDAPAQSGSTAGSGEAGSGSLDDVEAPQTVTAPSSTVGPTSFYDPPLLVTDIVRDEIQATTIQAATEEIQATTTQAATTVQSIEYPTSGIYGYEGSVSHSSNRDSGTDQFWMEINWQNRTLLGRIWDPSYESNVDEGVYFFGHYDAADPSLSRIFVIERHKRDDWEIDAIWGESTDALFSGSGAEFFSFAAAGDEYAMTGSQPLVDSWVASGSASLVLDPDINFIPPNPPVYSGFVMGKADNMADPGDYRVFMGELNLDIDVPNGTLRGSIGATDLDSTMSLGVAVGGSLGSAYVLDDQFIGIIGSGSTSLKTYGNFLVTVHPDRQFIVESREHDKETEYLTWGYWEIAYQAAGNDYHLFSDQGYWIAGVRTLQADIDRLHAENYTGYYQGGAIGIKITGTAGSTTTTNVNGTSDIIVKFGDRTVEGTITLDQAFTFDSLSLNADGTFTNGVHSINGALYGPEALAIGGNFHFADSTNRYYGIFGGMR